MRSEWIIDRKELKDEQLYLKVPIAEVKDPLAGPRFYLVQRGIDVCKGREGKRSTPECYLYLEVKLPDSREIQEMIRDYRDGF